MISGSLAGFALFIWSLIAFVWVMDKICGRGSTTVCEPAKPKPKEPEFKSAEEISRHDYILTGVTESGEVVRFRGNCTVWHTYPEAEWPGIFLSDWCYKIWTRHCYWRQKDEEARLAKKSSTGNG